MQEFDAPLPPQPDTAPFPPFVPIPPDAAMPPAPPTKSGRGRTLLLIAIAGVLALVLVAGGVLFVAAQKPKASVPPTLAQIVQRAQDANLQDAAFTIQANQSSMIAGTTISTTYSGTGEMTHVPTRLHITLQNPDGGLRTGALETIIDGNDVYIKLPQIPGVSNPFGKPWIKVSGLGTLGTSGLTGPDAFPVFDYQSLTNLKLVGTEKLSGKATWHIQGTVQSNAATNSLLGSTSSSETEDVWLLQSSYFPAQITVHSTSSLTSQAGGSSLSLTSTSNEVLTFTSWNTGVTIALPPPDQVTDGLGGFPTPTPAPNL